MLRLISWNMRRATRQSAAWAYLRQLEPEIAVLQEVGGVPEEIGQAYAVSTATPRTKHGKPQRFSTVVLARGQIIEELPLRASTPWLDELLSHFAGNILSVRLQRPGEEPLRLVNVYSPAWPVPRESYAGIDVSQVTLKQNPDLWVTDLVTAALTEIGPAMQGNWLVAGDFNSCVSFDRWKGGPRGNQEWLDRMARLGFLECLSGYHGRMVPTFKAPHRTEPTCQIDKVFATADLYHRLLACRVGEQARVLGEALSDHLPILAEFSRLSTHQEGVSDE